MSLLVSAHVDDDTPVFKDNFTLREIKGKKENFSNFNYKNKNREVAKINEKIHLRIGLRSVWANPNGNVREKVEPDEKVSTSAPWVIAWCQTGNTAILISFCSLQNSAG